jgi:hypothetical protein
MRGKGRNGPFTISAECFEIRGSMDHIFAIRLSTHLPSTKRKIFRDGSLFRLRKSDHVTHPIQLVTYLQKIRVYSDGFFGFKSNRYNRVRYDVMSAATRHHFILMLGLFPFYPSHGAVQWRNTTLWWGQSQLKIYARCEEYGEIRLLPYQVIEEP